MRLRYAGLQPDFGSSFGPSDPELRHLQASLGAQLSYREAADLLRMLLPPTGGTTHTSSRARLIAVGDRIDEEIRQEITENRKPDKLFRPPWERAVSYRAGRWCGPTPRTCSNDASNKLDYRPTIRLTHSGQPASRILWKMTVPLKPISESQATPTAEPRNSMTAVDKRFCSKTWSGSGIELNLSTLLEMDRSFLSSVRTNPSKHMISPIGAATEEGVKTFPDIYQPDLLRHKSKIRFLPNPRSF